MLKKVLIVCARRLAAEYVRGQLEAMLSGYARVDILEAGEEFAGRIRCDLVIAVSEEVAKQAAPFLMGDTEITVLHLTIRRDMYDKLKAVEGEQRALVINNTQEMALDTVAMLYALDVKKIELIPYYPGSLGIDESIRLAVTPGEYAEIPDFVERIVDIGTRCVDPLTLLEVFSRLGCLNQETVEMIFAYGQDVMSVNRGITELTKNGHDFGFSQRQFLESFDDAVLLLDERRRILQLNTAAQYVFGGSYAYLLHQDIRVILPELNGIEKNAGERRKIPVTVSGKRYLMSWNFFSGEKEGSSLLILKSFETMRSWYARYGNNQRKQRELKYSFDDIIGSSREMQALKDKARRFARTDFPVLIQGESGTGKELFAQAIHQASGRKNGPFIAFNCAALADSLLESELFGYYEGAFTGANKKGRAGYFEMAAGGTLFIDEIGDISLNMQAKILRVLQEQEVVRVGGSQAIPVDVRIISATNQDLQKMVRQKKFRLDLYYRLNTLVLQTLPLRERPSDIDVLLDTFFKRNQIRKNLSQAAMKFLLQYNWPGNVRELQNCVSYLSIVEQDMIELQDFPEYMKESRIGGKREERVPESPDRAVLMELKFLLGSGERTGRKRLSERLRERGLFITEAEMRGILQRLEKEEFVIIQKGRGGTRITQKGLDQLSDLG